MEKSLYNKILKIQKGDKEELLEVIIKFNPLIKSLKRKLNYEEAETDITIALIEVLLKLNNYNFTSDKEIVSFINRSIKNKSVDLFRKFILNKPIDLELNLELNLIDRLNLILNLIDRLNENIDNKILIEGLLDNLSDRHKFIIKEKYFNDNTEVEISKILNISRQAVNKSKKEAFIILRKQINKDII
ncbi:sigma-70 family RNA polymerase sigma factor [Clostridium perfringens]|nr:sigma-70 family RNA polymerase sigma factor [Clostridium perfringens]